MAYIRPMLQIMEIIAIGVILARSSEAKKHIRMLSIVLVNVLIPALVFQNVYRSDIRLAECLAFFTALLASYLCVLGITWCICKGMKLSPQELRAACLTAPYSNNGAAGYTIIYAFLGAYYGGIAALASAFQNILVNISAPLIIRSRGQRAAGNLRELARLPVLYALILGYLLRLGGVVLPGIVAEPLSQLASAAFPICLLLIGLQLDLRKVPYRMNRILMPAAVKLLLMPAVVYVLIRFVLHLRMPYAVVVFILSGMPSASTMVAIAGSYGTQTEAELVSAVTVVTTLASMVTIPCVLYLAVMLFAP